MRLIGLALCLTQLGCFSDAPGESGSVSDDTSTGDDHGSSGTTSSGATSDPASSDDDGTQPESDVTSSSGSADDVAETSETDDPPPPACEYHVFVSSQEWQAQALGGLEGAREWCNGAAPFAPGNWQPVLSTENASAPGADGVVCDLDGNVIADDDRPWWGPQGHHLPISLTENGPLPAASTPLVWTATTHSGTYNPSGDCGQWGIQPIIAGASASVGDATESSISWVSHQTLLCAASARLYCIARSR